MSKFKGDIALINIFLRSKPLKAKVPPYGLKPVIAVFNPFLAHLLAMVIPAIPEPITNTSYKWVDIIF